MPLRGLYSVSYDFSSFAVVYCFSLLLMCLQITYLSKYLGKNKVKVTKTSID